MFEAAIRAEGIETGDPGVLLKVLMAFRNGDFSARMPCDRVGLEGKIADTLNEIIDPA